MILFDFTGDGAASAWRAVDDRVMGGVSSSRLRAAGDHAVFEGTVSGDHNGGFASVRARIDGPVPADIEHLALEVRGDGASYFANLRTDDGFDGLSYRTDFRPGGIWTTIELPLADFAPTFRGRDVPGAPPFEPSRIHQIGLMIAERQFGPFSLALRRIALS